MAEKQYTGSLARIEKWLDAVTEKDLLKGVVIVVLTGIFTAVIAYSVASKMEIPGRRHDGDYQDYISGQRVRDDPHWMDILIPDLPRQRPPSRGKG